MPLTVGGGVRTLDDIRNLLLAGADKVVDQLRRRRRPRIRRARRPRSSASQCIVVAIDAKQVGAGAPAAGRSSPMAAASRPASTRSTMRAKWSALGAGEILLTSMDRDGTKRLRHRADPRGRRRGDVPVIASGGVGTLDHLVDGVTRGPRQRGAGGLDLPFRRIHHPPGQGAHGGGRRSDADGLTPTTQRSSWPAMTSALT